ncbi:Coproporphyrinogen-III oxidase, partial [Dinochytrium kinnereticum]
MALKDRRGYASAPASGGQPQTSSGNGSIGIGVALFGVMAIGGSLWLHADGKPINLTSTPKAPSSDSSAASSTTSPNSSEGAEKKPCCNSQPPAEVPKGPMRERMEAFVRELQKEIVSSMEKIENSLPVEEGAEATARPFLRDQWLRKEGGEGTSCILQDGKVFEKAGVLVSVVHGPAPDRLMAQMRARAKEGIDPLNKSYAMFAAGISLVIHPTNPNAPTVHLNYRYFELSEKDAEKPVAWWFGGGCDLTPSYLFEEDAVHFHSEIKQACDKHDAAYYPKFKK